LRNEDLVTDRAPTIVRARDGAIIEVSEWESREAIGRSAQQFERPRDVKQISAVRLRAAQHAFRIC
jgi:hypothetical protein